MNVLDGHCMARPSMARHGMASLGWAGLTARKKNWDQISPSDDLVLLHRV